MGDQKSDDWLPDGWRVEVKLRKNGKRDKLYFAPSKDLKFYSKLEVCRYLNIIHRESEEKEKGHSKKSEKNVVLEKVKAEGLPPGWIKEIRVTKKGRKVRRDSFYTDPISGYVFRSLKDALRYLESGDIGRLAFKPKDEYSYDVNMKNNNTCSPTLAKKQKLEVIKTGRQSTIQSLESRGMAEDGRILNDSVNAGECKFLPHKGGVGADLSGSNLSEAGGSEPVEEGKDFDATLIVSTLVVEELPDKQSLVSGITRDEKKRRNSEKTKNLITPRRASKRLAGLALDPTPELTSNRTRQAVRKLSSEPEVNCNVYTHKSSEEDSIKSKHLAEDLATPSDYAGEVEMENRSDKKRGSSIVLAIGNIAKSEKHSAKVETGSKVDVSIPPPDLPSMDLWTDPCIAFAIKTLTEVSFDTSKIPQVLPVSNDGEYPCGGLSTLDGQCINNESGNGGGKKQGRTAVLPQGNLTDLEEHCRKVGSSDKNKTDENPRSTHDMPFADIWTDPCIDFAIKTLTGAIPVGFDMHSQDYLQQPLSSSQTQASRVSPLPEVGLGNFCQTEFLCQQFDAAEKPLSKEQAPNQPRFNHSSNVGIRNSCGSDLNELREERCHR